jgi:predicted nucleic acid-binding protein
VETPDLTDGVVYVDQLVALLDLFGRDYRVRSVLHLRSFPDLEIETADYEEAAAAFNRCCKRGIQVSNTDFLICAAALRRDLTVYTTDGDRHHYARVLRLKLHEPRS